MESGERDTLFAEVSALKQELAERDTLIRDVHHRVKNNLFLLIGLLSFERRTLEHELADPAPALRAIDRVVSRIHVVSSIYSHLYEIEPSAREISARAFLERLARLVSVSETERSVEIIADICDVYLPVHAALPVGLIVNEALSNSYKHAFPDGRPGTIALRLRQIEHGRARLILSDDGVGKLPSDDQASATDLEPKGVHMGMRLIETLVQQLGGTLHTPVSEGTTIEVEFPLHHEN